jgi:hypothetical protein
MTESNDVALDIVAKLRAMWLVLAEVDSARSLAYAQLRGATPRSPC